jgi:hypothetical protein
MYEKKCILIYADAVVLLPAADLIENNETLFLIPFCLQSVPMHSANCVNNIYNGMYKSVQ